MKRTYLCVALFFVENLLNEYHVNAIQIRMIECYRELNWRMCAR